MRRFGFTAIFLVILILSCCISPVLAADNPDAQETVAAPSAEITPDEDSAGREDSEQDPDGAEPPASEEPSAPASDAPVQTPEPTLDPDIDPSEEPTSSAEPTAELTSSSGPVEEPSETSEPSVTPTPPHEAPSLEMSAGQTIYLNQETPAVKIRWKSGIPENVAGYVWSFGEYGSRHVFYVTYDARSTTLAAGALNGHISEAGTYSIECQPVDAEQQPATPAAEITLRVEDSACELTITASANLPVAAGSELTLTAHAGNLGDDVTKYEWKPAGNGSGSRVCKISDVAAGPVRYTCTAVLGSGQRITGTIVVTGTELIPTQRTVTLDGMTDSSLSVAWSNGKPDQSIRYRWSVRGESSVDLSSRSGATLPSAALEGLPSRDNPYTVSCQAYDDTVPLGSPATFQVRVAHNGVTPSVATAPRTIAGDENGRVPNTDDSEDKTRVPLSFLFLGALGLYAAAHGLLALRTGSAWHD